MSDQTDRVYHERSARYFVREAERRGLTVAERQLSATLATAHAMLATTISFEITLLEQATGEACPNCGTSDRWLRRDRVIDGERRICVHRWHNEPDPSVQVRDEREGEQPDSHAEPSQIDSAVDRQPAAGQHEQDQRY